MKRSVAVETEETDISTGTENLLGHTARRMSNPELETSSSEAVTSEAPNMICNTPTHSTVSSSL